MWLQKSQVLMPLFCLTQHQGDQHGQVIPPDMLAAGLVGGGAALDIQNSQRLVVQGALLLTAVDSSMNAKLLASHQVLSSSLLVPLHPLEETCWIFEGFDSPTCFCVDLLVYCCLLLQSHIMLAVHCFGRHFGGAVHSCGWCNAIINLDCICMPHLLLSDLPSLDWGHSRGEHCTALEAAGIDPSDTSFQQGLLQWWMMFTESIWGALCWWLIQQFVFGWQMYWQADCHRWRDATLPAAAAAAAGHPFSLCAQDGLMCSTARTTFCAAQPCPVRAVALQGCGCSQQCSLPWHGYPCWNHSLWLLMLALFCIIGFDEQVALGLNWLAWWDLDGIWSLLNHHWHVNPLGLVETHAAGVHDDPGCGCCACVGCIALCLWCGMTWHDYFRVRCATSKIDDDWDE